MWVSEAFLISGLKIRIEQIKRKPHMQNATVHKTSTLKKLWTLVWFYIEEQRQPIICFVPLMWEWRVHSKIVLLCKK